MSELLPGVVAGVGKAASTLPGQFLALVLMNTIFIGGLLAFLDRQEATRARMWTEVAGPLLRDCAAAEGIKRQEGH